MFVAVHCTLVDCTRVEPVWSGPSGVRGSSEARRIFYIDAPMAPIDGTYDVAGGRSLREPHSSTDGDIISLPQVAEVLISDSLGDVFRNDIPDPDILPGSCWLFSRTRS